LKGIRRVNILQVLPTIQNLPSLPAVVLQVHKMLESNNTDAHEMDDLIAHDPPLASMVLKTANSVFYLPANQRISSVQNAIVRLGLNTVSKIALAIDLIRHFPGSTFSMDHALFWRHCVAAAYLAEEISSHVPLAAPGIKERAFTAGLLHDIGLIIYDQFFHDQYGRIKNIASQKKISYLAAENELAGSETHAMVGGAMLELWKLDSAVVSAIRYHHNPQKAPETYSVLSSVAFLCEYMLCNSSIGSIEGTMEGDADEEFFRLGIDPETRQFLLINAQNSIAAHSVAVTRVVNSTPG
jgi:putative nucleotidyltransferase with HDIG domain